MYELLTSPSQKYSHKALLQLDLQNVNEEDHGDCYKTKLKLKTYSQSILFD